MKQLLSLLFCFCMGLSHAQDLVLIKFADKPSAQTYLSDPTSILSQKAY